MPLPRPLRVFLGTLLTLTGVCLLTEFLAAHFFHLLYPYDWPLYTPEHSFNDLIIYHPRFAAFGTAAFFDPPWYPFTYPAPVALLYRFFYGFTDYITAFLIAAGAIVAAAIGFFTRTLASRSIAASQRAESSKLASRKLTNQALSRTLLLMVPTVLCAYPIAFEFQQANLEIFVTLFTALGIWAFYRERPWPAAILFGLAASLKLFPIVFLVLFLSRRLYRQAAVSAIVTFVSVTLSLALACPSPRAALAGMQAGAAFFQHEYALRTTTAFDHSLFALVKAAAVLHDPAQTFLAPATLTVYLACAAAAVLAVCLRIRNLPLLNQVLALSVAAILFPPVSFDYTLLNLYAPWALLVLFTLQAPHARGLTPMFACLAVLLAPTSELILHGVALGAQLKSLALLALLAFALRRSGEPAFRSSANSPA